MRHYLSALLGICWGALTLLTGEAAATSLPLPLLSTLDPCHCPGPPFDWSYSDIWGFASGGSEFAVLGAYTGLYIIDVTVPTAPVVASFVPGANSNWRESRPYGNYIYSVNEEDGGLQIIDISNPYAAFEVASITTFFHTAHTIHVDAATQRAYCFGARDDLPGENNFILNIANPVAPTLLGNYEDRYLHDGYSRGNTLFGAKIYTNGMHGAGMYILDVTNPAAIDTVTIVTWPNAFTHNVWTTEDGHYAFTTDENTGGHVHIWDVSNLPTVLPVSEYQVAGEDHIVHNVYIRGNRAYASYYWEGVRVVDLTDIQNPTEIAFYDTSPGQPTGSYGGCWGVYPFLPSGIILASDVERGLYVFTAPSATGIDEPAGAPPSLRILSGVAPNPFSAVTTAAVEIPGGNAARIRLSVYDVQGRSVRRLADGSLAAGRHELPWDGRDDGGRPLASGIYYLRLETTGLGSVAAKDRAEVVPVVLAR
jgi:choice-of-anchor B domain-containing protein